MYRELTELDEGNFEYVPFWDAQEERIDMRLRVSEPADARIGALDLDLHFATAQAPAVGVEDAVGET